MGGDGRCGVLQHRCGRGKRELAPIWEWRSSEGAHRRGERQRQRSAKSDVRERPSMAGGSGSGAEAVGRGATLGVDEAGSVTREVGRVFERARSAARLRGKKEKREGGGPAVGAAWGLAPTGGRCPDRVPVGRDPGTARTGDASLLG
jgi:hypothetical protein